MLIIYIYINKSQGLIWLLFVPKSQVSLTWLGPSKRMRKHLIDLLYTRSLLWCLLFLFWVQIKIFDELYSFLIKLAHQGVLFAWWKMHTFAVGVGGLERLSERKRRQWKKEKQSKTAAVMDLRSELLKCIWYAFTALDVEKSGKVSKSQLKVSCKSINALW